MLTVTVKCMYFGMSVQQMYVHTYSCSSENHLRCVTLLTLVEWNQLHDGYYTAYTTLHIAKAHYVNAQVKYNFNSL